MAGLFSDSGKEVKKPRRPGEKERCFQILGEIPYPRNTCKLFACKEKDTDRQVSCQRTRMSSVSDQKLHDHHLLSSMTEVVCQHVKQ